MLIRDTPAAKANCERFLYYAVCLLLCKGKGRVCFDVK